MNCGKKSQLIESAYQDATKNLDIIIYSLTYLKIKTMNIG